jgi:hypothetical protein
MAIQSFSKGIQPKLSVNSASSNFSSSSSSRNNVATASGRQPALSVKNNLAGPTQDTFSFSNRLSNQQGAGNAGNAAGGNVIEKSFKSPDGSIQIEFSMEFNIQTNGGNVGTNSGNPFTLNPGFNNPPGGSNFFAPGGASPVNAPVTPNVPVMPNSQEGDTTFLDRAAPQDQQRYLRASNGDRTIANTLARMATDPEGRRVLDMALAKGTTYQRGNLPGNTVGQAQSGGGRPPVITLEDPTSIDTVAHETAHAVFDDAGNPTPGDGVTHDDVYKFGHLISQRLTGSALRDPYGNNSNYENNAISRIV